MYLVQSLSRVRLFVTPWTAAHQASLSITSSRSPPEPMSIKLVMPSNHLILRRPLLLLPSIFPSIRVFSNESALLIRWPKYWSFSFSISPSNEHPGLISFRTDWLDLLAVQGTLKSLLQHHSSKATKHFLRSQLRTEILQRKRGRGFAHTECSQKVSSLTPYRPEKSPAQGSSQMPLKPPEATSLTRPPHHPHQEKLSSGANTQTLGSLRKVLVHRLFLISVVLMLLLQLT